MELAEFRGWFHRDADGVAEEGVDGFDPEDLGGEYFAEVAGDGFGYCGHV